MLRDTDETLNDTTEIGTIDQTGGISAMFGLARKPVSSQPALRPNQVNLVEDCVQSLLQGKRTVLGAATGSGKTIMGAFIADRATGPKANVGWIAHGLTTLRDQAFEENCNFLPGWTVRRITPEGVEVREGDPNRVMSVFLPQAYNNKPCPEFDMLVVDEAHERFLLKAPTSDSDESMVQKILKQMPVEPKLLLLSATPFRFNNDPNYACHHYSLGNLYKDGLAADMNWEMAFTPLDKRIDEYLNAEGDIIEGKELPARFQEELLLKVLRSLAYRVRMDVTETSQFVEPGFLEKLRQFGRRELLKFFRTQRIPKTLFIAHSIKQARWLAKELQNLGLRTIASDSENDPNSELVKAFTRGQEYDVLVVVDRCTLGWNYPSLKFVIDFSFTRNIPRIIQTVGRLTRPYEIDGVLRPNAKKLYIKCCTQSGAPFDTVYCNKAVQVMMDAEEFASFSGDLNVNGKVIQAHEKIRREIERMVQATPRKVQEKLYDPDDTVSFWEMSDATPKYFDMVRHSADESVAIYATTTLRAEYARIGEWKGGAPFEERVLELEAYFAEHHKLPSHKTSLGKFANNMRQTHPERLDVLMAKYGVTLQADRVEQKWIELEAHFAEHHKLPSQKTSLGKFANSMRQNQPERLDVLMAKYGVTLLADRVEQKWIELEAYFAEHHKLPSRKTSLGGFVNNKRTTHPDRLDVLMAKYGVTLLADRVEQKWIELEAHFAEHHKLPSQKTSLGKFANSMRQNQPERLDVLMAKYGVKRRNAKGESNE